jgi:hypothetical protein
LHRRNAHPSTYKQQTAHGFLEKEDGSWNQALVTYRPDIRLGASLSFVRQTDGRSYADHQAAFPPIRSREQARLGHDLSEALEQYVKERQAELAAAQNTR